MARPLLEIARCATTFALTAAVAAAVTVAPVRADSHRSLFEAMRLPDVLEVMRDEGLSYGVELREQMFPGVGTSGWPEVISDIYAPERLEETFLDAFEGATGDIDTAPLVAFFTSERGQAIVELEISARRALLDPAVEDAAGDFWRDLADEDDARADLIERFVEVNDLIEANVAGAMNSSVAFYEGLSTGSSFDGAWTMDRILATVWNQEGEIREDTRDWIYSYLTLAFEPLSTEDVEAYIALSESAPGRALNSALFAAFDVLFVEISRDVGAAAARYLDGQDI